MSRSGASPIGRPTDVEPLVVLNPRLLERRPVAIKPVAVVPVEDVVPAETDPPVPEADEVLHRRLGGVS